MNSPSEEKSTDLTVADEKRIEKLAAKIILENTPKDAVHWSVAQNVSAIIKNQIYKIQFPF